MGPPREERTSCSKTTALTRAQRSCVQAAVAPGKVLYVLAHATAIAVLTELWPVQLTWVA